MAPIHNAVKSGNLNRVKTLLNQGVPVNARNETRWTPLHDAASSGHLSVVQELLKRGAHVNPRSISGYTPLHVAALWRHPHVIHALIKAGANPKYRTMNGRSAYNYTEHYGFRNAMTASPAAAKWNNMVRKRRAARMLASPRLLGSTKTKLNNKSISNIARYLTVKKKNNTK